MGIDRNANVEFGGRLIFPGDPEYDLARRVWNQVIDRKPAVIARCDSPGHVAQALRLAAERGLEVAVRGGAHSFPGHSTSDGGLVIDLSGMKELHVDVQHGRLTAGPGLRWGEIADATAPHGLAAVGGHVAAVGVSGLTLGGGNGWLARRHGLACDNLISADVVTADGRIVHASAEHNPDLYWALRGGGGNFGVVVRFTLKLHPLAEAYGGMALHGPDRAADALRFLRELYASGHAGDELSVAAAVVTAPPEPYVPVELQGGQAVLLAAAYFGPVDEGERVLAPLREFGPPAAEQFGVMPWLALQHFFDANGISTRFHMRAHLVDELHDGVIDAALTPDASPLSAVIILPMGGAAGRVAPDATPYFHRRARYCVEVAAAWLSADEDAERAAWSEGVWEAMRPWSLGPDLNHLADEGPDRVREAYGDNYSRLAALKRTWDPDNVFRLNQNIPPA
jgi:FAD/FMN-containing dehydrogenase